MIFTLLASFFSVLVSSMPIATLERYSKSILTPHYGILNETDLVTDAKIYQLVPYKKDGRGGGAFWQCFSLKYVRTKKTTWRAPDPMGRVDEIVSMCEIEIIVLDKIRHSFGDRRAHQLQYCRDFFANWNMLTRGERFVCLNGEPNGIDKTTIPGETTHNWVWNKFKTRKGCYGYFANWCPG